VYSNHSFPDVETLATAKQQLATAAADKSTVKIIYESLL